MYKNIQLFKSLSRPKFLMRFLPPFLGCSSHPKSPVQTDLLGTDGSPPPPVEVLVDEVKHGRCGACKQAGPLHGNQNPLHKAAHKLPKLCGVVGKQEQSPTELLAMVNN